MARRRQRGFVLIAALALAILYFMLMELILMDSSRALIEAQRFRARTVASAMAENGAELAAQSIVSSGGKNIIVTDAQGDTTGTVRRAGNQFELDGWAKAKGAMSQTATVKVQGRINADNTIEIDFTEHTQ